MHNLIGQKRNKLTILERTSNKGGKTAWIAQCECGNKYKQQEGLCALSGQTIKLNVDASLDRIDSNKGYYIDNIQWIHKDINRIKSDFDQKYFIDICKLIADYTKSSGSI